MDHKPRCKIIKLLEYNIRENVGEFRYSNDFLIQYEWHNSFKKLIS